MNNEYCFTFTRQISTFLQNKVSQIGSGRLKFHLLIHRLKFNISFSFFYYFFLLPTLPFMIPAFNTRCVFKQALLCTEIKVTRTKASTERAPSICIISVKQRENICARYRMTKNYLTVSSSEKFISCFCWLFIICIILWYDVVQAFDN